MSLHGLSFLIGLPVVGGLFLLFMRDPDRARTIALFFSLLIFGFSLYLLVSFDPQVPGMQFHEVAPWIPLWNINYAVGVDGISILFILLTTGLSTIALASSWHAIRDRVPAFLSMLLFAEGGLIGVFSALDLFLFYFFWEAMLIPFFLLIVWWGGVDRFQAGIRFFLFNLGSSALLLVGIIAVYGAAGETFDMSLLIQHSFSRSFQLWVFPAFFIPCAVRMSLFPFHAWQLDATYQMPDPASILSVGVLAPLGAYVFLRLLLPCFPDATKIFSTGIMLLSLVGLLYCGWIAFAQTDMKKMISFLALIHISFITMGFFSLTRSGIEGAVFQTISVGMVIGILLFAVGIMQNRLSSTVIADYGGMAGQVPFSAAFFLIAILSFIGLPGTNGFVGIFITVFGLFERSQCLGTICCIGLLLAGWCGIRFFQNVMLGPGNPRKIHDLDAREISVAVPGVLVCIALGMYPKMFLDLMHAPLSLLMHQMQMKIQAFPGIATMLAALVGN
ncbi:MAG: NADH-quinone oxidoreductase subunit M [Nitrospirota bacterium]